ncbi:MAG: hypothetical protein IH899_10215 [Planctomycetes bacterium]|nr:hypothetical protein [Planctomycetota bacterium]
MKKLTLLSALVVGLFVIVGTNTARADHCSSYGYGYSPSRFGSFTSSYVRSGYLSNYGRSYGRSYGYSHYGHSSPGFSYYSPRFSISVGSGHRGFSYGHGYRSHHGSHGSFGSHRGHSGRRHH